MKLTSSYLLAGSALLFGEAVTASGPLKIPLASRRATAPTTHSSRLRRADATATEVELDTWIQHNADLQWFMNITVGTPPQPFTVLVDTGSADLLIPASNCTNCGQHNRFDASKSTSFQTIPGDTSIEAAFGTQGDTQPVTKVSNLTAHLVVDSVTLAGLTVPQLPFVLIDFATEGLVTMPMDGILGFSPLNLTHFSETGQGTTFFWSLVQSGAVPSPVFAIQLNSGDEANGGELTLGGVDNTKYEGELSYVDFDMAILSLALEWFIDTPAIYVGDKQVTTAPGLALLDTGTAYIMTPDNATAAALYAAISPEIVQIDPAGAWGAPCDTLAGIKAENIQFTIGPAGQTKNLTLPAGSFNLGEYPGKPGICQAVFVNTAPGAEIQDPEGKGRVAWTFGSPLMKGYYNVFDQTDPTKLKYGFAPIKRSSDSTSAGALGGRPLGAAMGLLGLATIGLVVFL